MAEEKQNKKEESSSEKMTTNSFTKGMLKDYNDTFVGEGLYTHARNSVNNSHLGEVGVIGNEPSNLHCVTLPYTLIGAISIYNGEWVLFTTDNINSEIGLFNENTCSYTKIVNSSCLNFKTSNLITGAYRLEFDCKRIVYFADGLNPDRVLNIDDVPYKYKEKITNDCIEKIYSTELDCEKLRLSRFIKHPCINLKKSVSSGTLTTGSYQVCLAYTINRVKVSDYLGLSEIQPLFTHESGSGEMSLDVEIVDIDKSFSEFELVVISNVNSQTTAKSLGYYSTSVGIININTISPELVSIPLSDIIFRRDSVEKSDAMYPVGEYLIRAGIYNKYKFNYQPLANKIVTKWTTVKYSSDYYYKGGNNVGYLRDEVYSFFIRWIYNTGEKSESYHIPGRQAFADELEQSGSPDAFEITKGEIVKKWQVENTGKVTNLYDDILFDGGTITASGEMAYWESAERYPADKPEIWGNLCGKPIRHHKMPDETVDPILNITSDDGKYINILGVVFENIKHPVDIDGNPIESIVGYEILRGSREGQKSIVAKGIINNMREYTIPGNNTVKGLFQNYPFNDVRPDFYLTNKQQTGGETGEVTVSSSPMTAYKNNIFSFHSPETTFSKPYLAVNELKIYGEMYGQSVGQFNVPFRHPKFKVLTNFTTVIGSIIGVLSAVGVFSKGIQIGATESHPVGFTLGPLSPMPSWTDVVGVSSTTSPAASAANFLTFGAQVASWVADTTTLVLVGNQFAELEKEKVLSLMLMLIPKKQYAAQYNSHGFYNNFLVSSEGNRRKLITESLYTDSAMQSFNLEYQINNVNRSRFVALQIEDSLPNTVKIDDSRYTLGMSKNKALNVNETSNISSHYGALKVSINSQYGQLDSIKQLVISECISYTSPNKSLKYKSDVLFGGDVYINRFTEKNTMFFFDDWLIGQPDETQYDYTLYQSLPYTRFWLTSTEYQGSDILSQASKWRALDYIDSSLFYVKRGYFYLFNSGVKDFYVESEINLALRDWEDDLEKRHYDPYRYTDLNSLFRSDYIKAGNYYKYDYALSASKLYSNFVSWGQMLPSTYDPVVANTCFKYLPYRVIYSLPQELESISDNWRVFLFNNYYDFESKITAIKQVNKTGALFMMNNMSPLQFMGVDQLQTDQGLKVTIGDGGLFNQALQNIVNSDDAYEYGSCQNRYSVIGTMHGIFWVSQNQGKIFQYSSGLNEISNSGMKWWFAKYLPSELLKKFPEYPHSDNPVFGVGVQSVYDNINEIVYFTKKDYKPHPSLQYDSQGFYNIINNIKTYYALGDPQVFEDASWTISYDPKSKTWISFHDWIPTFLIPGKGHFMSINKDSIWKHNIRCDSYCNFYGIDYPWEIEFVSSTGQTVTTLRNIEYLLEAYKFYNDCRDKFHVLDRNFDEAIIYNSEQVSGVLQLNLKPKNNPLALLKYPAVRTDYIDILYAKEENKYRFNQFWDITKDRGEFISSSLPDISNIPMFITEANGYKFKINPDYVNYAKSPTERKKFRHYVNRVFLKAKLNGNIKYLFKLSNQKIQQSFR